MPRGRKKYSKQQRIAKFWSGTQISDLLGCWEWQKGLGSPFGYGVFYFDGKSQRAHRVSWTIVYGPIPAGLWVLHKCDNPGCVNPSHLYLGTAKDNMRDSVERGRRPAKYNQPLNTSYQPRLRNNSREYKFTAKLTPVDVIQIRKLLASGKSGGSIAKQYSVCRQSIWNIKHRRCWASLP